MNNFGRYGAGYEEFKNPASVFTDGGAHIIVVDFNNYRVQVLTRDGVPTLEFGDNDLEKLHYPMGCNHNGGGRILISDCTAGEVLVLYKRE